MRNLFPRFLWSAFPDTLLLASSELSQRIKSCHTSVSVQNFKSQWRSLRKVFEGLKPFVASFRQGKGKPREPAPDSVQYWNSRRMPCTCTLLLGGGGSVESNALDFAEYTRIAISCKYSANLCKIGQLQARNYSYSSYGISYFEIL